MVTFNYRPILEHLFQKAFHLENIQAVNNPFSKQVKVSPQYAACAPIAKGNNRIACQRHQGQSQYK